MKRFCQYGKLEQCSSTCPAASILALYEKRLGFAGSLVSNVSMGAPTIDTPNNKPPKKSTEERGNREAGELPCCIHLPAIHGYRGSPAYSQLVQQHNSTCQHSALKNARSQSKQHPIFAPAMDKMNCAAGLSPLVCLLTPSTTPPTN